jgi:hypothetical protein
MQFEMADGSVVEIPDAKVLQAAGKIYQRRRKTHGHPPLKRFVCEWCRGELQGRAAFDAHTRVCDARPSAEITAADLIPWEWPESAA